LRIEGFRFRSLPHSGRLRPTSDANPLKIIGTNRGQTSPNTLCRSAKPVFMGPTPIRCSIYCSSLEAGSDGVGRSNLRLAARLTMEIVHLAMVESYPGGSCHLEVARRNQPLLRKQNLPRWIEVHPTLCTEPACRYFRDV